MPDEKTHRLARSVRISARMLADYMDASERAKRSIVRNCKFVPIAKIVQHDEAKHVISRFLADPSMGAGHLHEAAARLRARDAESDFERDLFDHNADYIERFIETFPRLSLPEAEILPAGDAPPLMIAGVRINVELNLRLRRTTRTNRLKIGAATLRYAKGKALSPGAAAWQSAFLFGYLARLAEDEAAQPEQALCLTIDVYAGVAHPAPTDSVRRFQNIEAACESIIERWPNVKPPPNARL